MKLREGLFCLIPTKLTKLHHLQDFCANFSHIVCYISGGFIDSSGSLVLLSACLPLLSLLWAPVIRTVVFPSVRPVVENPSAKDAEDKSAPPCRSLVLFAIDHQANSEWPASCSEGIVKHMQQGNYSLRRPPKLIIPQAVIAQWAKIGYCLHIDV